MDLWEDLKENGFSAIRNLCSERIPEGQRLEFKRKSNSEQNDLNRDDRKNLGESLSALSNAVGGVILFGIIAEMGDDGQDYAKEPQLLQNVDALAGKITSLVPEYLSPPNADVEVMSVKLSDETNTGVVAVRVGESDFRPHMSMAPGHRKYFSREESNNKPMVDYQVRDMLRINTTPRISLGYILRPNSRTGEIFAPSLVLILINEGQVSANNPYLMVHAGTNVGDIQPFTPSFTALQLADKTGRIFQGTGQFPLHPGLDVAVTHSAIHIKCIEDEYHISLQVGTGKFLRLDESPPIQMEISIGCEHTAARKIEFIIEPDELEEMADSIVRDRTLFRSKKRF